jgi:hypothetical protein
MRYRRSEKRALSEAIAALILISVAVAVGIIVWYTITSTARNVAPKGSILLIESVDASANTNVATIRVKNIGQAPININQITVNNGLSVTYVYPNLPFQVNPGVETSITITVNSNFQQNPSSPYVVTINYNIANGPSGSASYSFQVTQ